MHKPGPPGHKLIVSDVVMQGIWGMAETLRPHLQDEKPLVIPILTGGIWYAHHLMSLWDFQLEIDYLRATRYGKNTIGSSIEVPFAPHDRKIRGRTVLLIDDIMDEGHTLEWARSWCQSSGAERILITVLIDRVTRDHSIRRSPYYYPVLRTEHAGFLFGCGMDLYGFWRQLGSIYTTQEVK